MSTQQNTHPLRAIQERFFNLRPETCLQKLFVIGLQANTNEFSEFLDDMLNCSDPKKTLAKVFPGLADLYAAPHEYGGDELAQMLTESDFLGFVCEIHIAECDNFTWKADGSVGRFAVHPGICGVEYCYGNTLEQMMDAVEKRVAEEFEYMVEKARKKQTV